MRTGAPGCRQVQGSCNAPTVLPASSPTAYGLPLLSRLSSLRAGLRLLRLSPAASREPFVLFAGDTDLESPLLSRRLRGGGELDRDELESESEFESEPESESESESDSDPDPEDDLNEVIRGEPDCIL
jgi:hypothetical protein